MKKTVKTDPLKLSKKDVEFVFGQAVTAYEELKNFKEKWADVLNEWQELESKWDASRFALSEAILASDFVNSEGKVIENDILEVYYRNGRVTVMPKDYYQKKR